MEKIIVISYRFPPADETGTQRTWALAKYLKSMGYYPVFVTRNWNHPLKTLEDFYVPVGSETEHEKHESYEVFILPFKNLLQLRLRKRFKTQFSFIRKIYNLLDYVLMYFGIFALNEYNSFLKKASEIAAADPSIRKAIVITEPYPLFYIGYYLNKKFGIKWIADYRDDWNTREVTDTYHFQPTLLHRISQRITTAMEKKWVGTAEAVTSVSHEYTSRIVRFVGVKGTTIYNGFFEEDHLPAALSPQPAASTVRRRFTIVHNGTLYPQQPIEIFLSGYKMAVDKYRDRTAPELKFIGVTYKPGSQERIDEAMTGYENYYVCTDRIPKQDLFREIELAQVALLVSFGKEFKGLTTSKIFDYVGSEKTVLCCPPDGDVVEEILTETGLGYFCETDTEVFTYLSDQIEKYLDESYVSKKVNTDAAQQYSRRNQTQKIADLLDTF